MILTRKRFIQVGLGAAATAVLGACGDDETGGGGTQSSGGSGNASAGGSGNEGGTGNSSAGGSGNAGGGTGNAGGTGASGGSGGMSTSACVSGSMIVAAISQNHGHALEIPYDDVIAGVEMTYDASGSAAHCHEVTITAADFAILAGGGTITLHSCNGTDHEFVLSCEASPPAPAPPDCSGTPNFGAC